MVVFWDAVHPYFGASNPEVNSVSFMHICYFVVLLCLRTLLQENSFQAILITDGTYSYTIFIYDCNLTEWDNGVTIGYSAAGDPYYNNDPSSSEVACLNLPDSNYSNVIYLLSDDSPELPPPGKPFNLSGDVLKYMLPVPNTLLFASTEDISVNDVGKDTANITWRIPYFTEQEEYYIIYGMESDDLDQSSDSISSPTNTSLVNQTYSLMIQGLDIGTIYYCQVVAAFGEIGEFKRYSDTFAFRTKESGKYTYRTLKQ